MAAIRTDRPPGVVLRALSRRVFAGIVKDLEAASRGGGVHAVRKRLKLMRSLFRLVRPCVSRPEFERADDHLRRAADLLAGARRAEAMQEAAAKLKGAGWPCGEAAGELAEAARLAYRDRSSPQALQEAAREALPHIEAARSDVAGWKLIKGDIRPYAGAMADLFRKARRRLRKGLASGDAARLHRARKSVIHHLHHLEIVRRLWPALFGAWTSELLKLREALGDLNDLDELEKLIAGQPAVFSSGERHGEALTAMKIRRAGLVEQVQSHSFRLFAERPNAFRARIGAIWKGNMK